MLLVHVLFPVFVQIQWLRHNPEHGEGIVHQPLLAVTMLSSVLQTQGLEPIARANMMEELEGATLLHCMHL